MKIFALLAALIFSVANAQAALPPQAEASIDTFVEERMDADGIPGLSLVIVQGQDVVYSQGYGLANIETQVPMTACTPVGPGSTVKSMTALAIMQLVEQGKVDLDAPVTTYLPWFRVASSSEAAPITVRHVLSMTAGLHSPLDASIDSESTKHISDFGVPHSEDALEQRVRGLADITPLSTPGEVWSYSSDGYATAGLIIETVTGIPYEQYMQEQVFAPLGMTSTAFGSSLEGIAQGYLAVDGQLKPEGHLQIPGYRPAGSDVVSSACDFGRYLVAYLNGGQSEGQQVISESSIETMWTPLVRINSRDQYALGWYVQDWNGVKVVNHGGHAMTSSSAMFVMPEHDLAVAVLANVDDLQVDSIAQALLEQMSGTSATPEREASTFVPDRNVWNTYVGTYETVYGTPLRIYVEDSELKGFIEGPNIPFTLEAFSDNTFVTHSDISDVDNADAAFTVDADGTVRLTMAGQEIGVKKP